MAGALDAAVDALSTPVERAPLGVGVMTGSGESPGLTKDYHLDQPIDQRKSFAKSVNDDGGIVILAAPTPNGATAREALLASDQERDKPAGATVVMRPRVVEQHRGEGKARRGQGIPVNPTDIGLAMRPIMIQRQADVDEMGNALDPEGIQPRPFASDGTAKGGERITELQSVTLPDGKVAAAPAPARNALEAVPYTPASQVEQSAPRPVQGAGVIVATTPKQRIVYEPPSGGKIRASADEVVVSPTMILVISDANSDTSYEPAKATSDAPIKLGVGTEVFPVVYGGWSGEKNGKLYMVFVRVPDPKPAAP